MTDDVLATLWAQVQESAVRPDLDEIAALANSSDPAKRIFALLCMRERIEDGSPPAQYFDLAHRMVRDHDNTCRWQALIVIGDSLDTNPEAVWGVICEFGDSDDADMRAGVACVLLEELLRRRFDDYFPKVRQWILRGQANTAKTLAMCWFDSCQGSRYKRVKNLVRNVSRGRPHA